MGRMVFGKICFTKIGGLASFLGKFVYFGIILDIVHLGIKETVNTIDNGKITV